MMSNDESRRDEYRGDSFTTIPLIRGSQFWCTESWAYTQQAAGGH